MIDNKFIVKYHAPIFNYIEMLTINDFIDKEIEFCSISFFKDFKIKWVYSQGLIYEKIYYKGINLNLSTKEYKEIFESEILNSFYSVLYFLLSDTGEHNNVFDEIKKDEDFILKIQLFIMTNPSNCLDLKWYKLKNYSIFLYKDFKTNDSIIIIIENNQFKNKYFLLNTYDENNFILKEKIEGNKFIFFINQYNKTIKDNLILKKELEKFLLLSIS